LWNELSSSQKHFPAGCDGRFLFRREFVRLDETNRREVLYASVDVQASERRANSEIVRGAFGHIAGCGMDQKNVRRCRCTRAEKQSQNET
jgi:hypothetical protein